MNFEDITFHFMLSINTMASHLQKQKSIAELNWALHNIFGFAKTTLPQLKKAIEELKTTEDQDHKAKVHDLITSFFEMLPELVAQFESFKEPILAAADKSGSPTDALKRTFGRIDKIMQDIMALESEV